MLLPEKLTAANDRQLRELSAIEAACFSVPLTEEQIARMIRDENTCWLAVREEDSVIAYVWVQTVLDEGYIGNVAVHPEYRRRGLGDLLLNELDRLAEERELRFLTLEVRAGNAPAIALYRKHGYAQTGLRPGYYSAPREDALLMTKEFA